MKVMIQQSADTVFKIFLDHFWVEVIIYLSSLETTQWPVLDQFPHLSHFRIFVPMTSAHIYLQAFLTSFIYFAFISIAGVCNFAYSIILKTN